MTPDVKAELELAAKASGRSISDELECRLKRTFDNDRELPGKLAAMVWRGEISQRLADEMMAKCPVDAEGNWKVSSATGG